jgi:hypothetical protein
VKSFENEKSCPSQDYLHTLKSRGAQKVEKSFEDGLSNARKRMHTLDLHIKMPILILEIQ